jgi:hypothetical protein
MDLLWSTQVVGLMAFVTAGCMVAGGLMVGRRWGRRAALAARPPARQPKRSGPRVMVVGVLGAEERCQRFEDAALVAATTFQASRRGPTLQAQSWCARAPDMWVEVGKVRIAIEGPVRIEVGSEEHYPPSPLRAMPRAVAKRLRAAQAVPSLTRVDVPRHGAFRSVLPGDLVVAVGLIEPMVAAAGAEPAAEPSWRLRPDDSGAVTLYYRRRPTVRGALGGVHAYAAA